jgi:hypothetical protein
MEVCNEEGPLIDSDRRVEEGFLTSEFVAVQSPIAQHLPKDLLRGSHLFSELTTKFGDIHGNRK